MDVIEAALAHVDKNAIRGAYNHAQYLKRRATMMTWWSERITQVAMGNLSLFAMARQNVIVANFK